MDFLERNLPLVVAFFPIHGDHWVQRRAVREAQFLSVLDSLFQMIKAVD